MADFLNKLTAADAVIMASWVASLIYWIMLLRSRTANGLPLVEPESRPRAFWSMAEFFVCFGLFLLCGAASQRFGIRYLSEEAQQTFASENIDWSQLTAQDKSILFLLANVAGILALMAVLVWMNLTTPGRMTAYGLLPTKRDIGLGLKASLLILPPVLMISFVINLFMDYQHDALDLMDGIPMGVELLAIVFVVAIWAPLFEEILFRGLLQGGAQRAAHQIVLRQPITLAPGSTIDTSAVSPEEVKQWPWWPVFMSSGIFALLHVEQGGAPVPLFFMALALAYLYRQTGRIGPGFVVHLVLNSFTTATKLLNL